MQSSADPDGQTDSVGQTTAGDAPHAEVQGMGGKRNGDGRVAPKRGTRYFLLQPSLPLIQATLVRGAPGAQTLARPVHSLLLACFLRLLLAPSLPPVRHLRQNLPTPLNPSVAPPLNHHPPQPL